MFGSFSGIYIPEATNTDGDTIRILLSDALCFLLALLCGSPLG